MSVKENMDNMGDVSKDHGDTVASCKQKMEPLAHRYVENRNKMKQLEEEKERLKEEMLKVFDDHGMYEVIVKGDGIEDFKVVRQETSTKVVDKEKLAEELKVPQNIIKPDMLVKMADEDKLTYDQYASHEFYRRSEFIQIRGVAPQEV